MLRVTVERASVYAIVLCHGVVMARAGFAGSAAGGRVCTGGDLPQPLRGARAGWREPRR